MFVSCLKSARSSNKREDVLLEKTSDTKKIKSENPGITGLPEGAWKKWSVGKLVNHFISKAKSKGKPAISKAVMNIERWNKNDNPTLSKKARSVMNKLKASKEWEGIGVKKESRESWKRPLLNEARGRKGSLSREEIDSMIQNDEDEMRDNILTASMDSPELFDGKYYSDTEAIQDIFDDFDSYHDLINHLETEFGINVREYVKHMLNEDLEKGTRVKVKPANQLAGNYEEEADKEGIVTNDFLFNYPEDEQSGKWSVVKFPDGSEAEILDEDLLPI